LCARNCYIGSAFAIRSAVASPPHPARYEDEEPFFSAQWQLDSLPAGLAAAIAARQDYRHQERRDDGLGEISWHNRIAGLQFLVAAKADCPPGPRPATLRVFVEGSPAGRIHFLIEVKAPAEAVGEPQPRGDAARNYRKAFISYASEDRTEVLKRVQTLSALRVDFFQDVLDLEPGQRWEKALYLHIDGSDLFLLFWSSAARKSSWVGKEIAYPLECQKHDLNGEPDIVRVIIEGPPPPPPPAELADLHFNDRLIYFMRS
jgi:TIR domain